MIRGDIDSRRPGRCFHLSDAIRQDPGRELRRVDHITFFDSVVTWLSRNATKEEGIELSGPLVPATNGSYVGGREIVVAAYVFGASGSRKRWVNNVNALKIDRCLLESNLFANGRREVDFGVSLELGGWAG